MQIIQQGLKITTSKRYLKFTQSNHFDVVEDSDLDSITIFFPRHLSSKYLVDKRIEVLAEGYLCNTDYIKISNPKFKIDGITFTKLLPHDYSFRQFLVKDIDQYIMSYNEHSCTILIPSHKAYRTDLYKDVLSKNPYLEVLEVENGCIFHNYRSFNMRWYDASPVSEDEFVFNSKKYYQQYLLDRISTEKSFIDQLTSIINDYGMDLIRYPIDSNTKSVNHIVWRFTDIGKQVTHKSEDNPLHHAILNKDTIEFEITCPDLVVLNDFKTKYQNLEFLSNFTEFYTRDKLDRMWKASVNWGVLPTDFNQDHDTDTQGNISFKSNITAEIMYYVVEDQSYRLCQEIIIEIVGGMANNPGDSKLIVSDKV